MNLETAEMIVRPFKNRIAELERENEKLWKKLEENEK